MFIKPKKKHRSSCLIFHVLSLYCFQLKKKKCSHETNHNRTTEPSIDYLYQNKMTINFWYFLQLVFIHIFLALNFSCMVNLIPFFLHELKNTLKSQGWNRSWWWLTYGVALISHPTLLSDLILNLSPVCHHVWCMSHGTWCIVGKSLLN